jgi:hypothetical protein
LRTIRTIGIDGAAEVDRDGAADRRRAGSCVHGDVRCACGSLLARIVEGAVELKCRRCKQTWRVPLAKG